MSPLLVGHSLPMTALGVRTLYPAAQDFLAPRRAESLSTVP
ncbi:MAG: hypothetical protein ACRDRU_24305 [Pseudonocardiaceae bacterium]